MRRAPEPTEAGLLGLRRFSFLPQSAAAPTRGPDMTVCIAAICEGEILLGASDRMITSGDVQFEPDEMKVRTLTSSIVVMFSGDAALHAEVAQSVKSEVMDRVHSEPETWLAVQEVAQLFVSHRNAVKMRRAEAAVLQPLGLTTESYLRGLHGFAEGMVKAIATDLVQYPMPYVSWIICGIDITGAHIYRVDHGALTCEDQVGFAAIGMGARHAESQLMSAEFSKRRSLAETLLLIYSAKKRAEVAPGVGSGTDLFTAGPGLGTVTPIAETVLLRVDAEYQKLRSGETAALEKAKTEMEEYVGQLRQGEEAVQSASGDALDDGES